MEMFVGLSICIMSLCLSLYLSIYPSPSFELGVSNPMEGVPTVMMRWASTEVLNAALRGVNDFFPQLAAVVTPKFDASLREKPRVHYSSFMARHGMVYTWQ